jgi:hypothetical protein
MRNLNIKIIFPYNWYHFRNVKIYNSNGDLISKIAHCENKCLLIEDSSKSIILKLDFFKSLIDIPENNDELYFIIYLNFTDTFPKKYFDILKRNCLSGKFVQKNEFDNFNFNFYDTEKRWILKSNLDKTNLILGLFISIALFIVSIFEKNNEDQDLVFFISLFSLISLIMIYTNKKNILEYDYKSRMIATGFAFILATFFLNSAFFITMSMLTISFLFLLKSIR